MVVVVVDLVVQGLMVVGNTLRAFVVVGAGVVGVGHFPWHLHSQDGCPNALRPMVHIKM